jgi:hypothetical protein
VADAGMGAPHTSQKSVAVEVCPSGQVTLTS